MIDHDYQQAVYYRDRLAAGHALTPAETQTLLSLLAQLIQERDDLAAALAPFTITIGQHPTAPQPDQWFYRVVDIAAGGPLPSAAAAWRAALAYLQRRHADMVER